MTNLAVFESELMHLLTIDIAVIFALEALGLDYHSHGTNFSWRRAMEINVLNGVAEILLGSTWRLASFFAVAALTLVLWRTRSSHVLLSRVWILVNGKRDCSVPDVKTFLAEQGALMEFRFMTGVRARTLAQVEQLIEWSKENNESISDVATCAEYFDLERRALKPKLPSNVALAGLLTVCIGIGVAMLVCVAAVAVDRAIIQMKATKNWYQISDTEVVPLFGGAQFALKDCDRRSMRSSTKAFPSADIDAICLGSKGTDVRAYVKSTVSDQRVVFAALTGLCLFYFCLFMSFFVAGSKAREMRRRLQSASGGGRAPKVLATEQKVDIAPAVGVEV